MPRKPRLNISIRKLEPQEARLYRAVRLACLKNAPDHFGSTYEEESRMPKLKFENCIEKEASEQFMWGGFDDGKIIGIVGFERLERQKARHRGEIVQMYVDESDRGQNIGEKLLRRLVKHAFSLNGIEQLQLSVIAGNHAAIKLYEELGFKTFGLQPRYFKVGDLYRDQQFMQLLKNEY